MSTARSLPQAAATVKCTNRQQGRAAAAEREFCGSGRPSARFLFLAGHVVWRDSSIAPGRAPSISPQTHARPPRPNLIRNDNNCHYYSHKISLLPSDLHNALVGKSQLFHLSAQAHKGSRVLSERPNISHGNKNRPIIIFTLMQIVTSVN